MSIALLSERLSWSSWVPPSSEAHVASTFALHTAWQWNAAQSHVPCFRACNKRTCIEPDLDHNARHVINSPLRISNRFCALHGTHYWPRIVTSFHRAWSATACHVRRRHSVGWSRRLPTVQPLPPSLAAARCLRPPPPEDAGVVPLDPVAQGRDRCQEEVPRQAMACRPAMRPMTRQLASDPPPI